jgi:hypothetical protein
MLPLKLPCYRTGPELFRRQRTCRDFYRYRDHQQFRDSAHQTEHTAVIDPARRSR